MRLHYYIGKELVWARVRNWGLSARKNPLFSQRNGYRKYIKIGNWYISTVMKN